MNVFFESTKIKAKAKALLSNLPDLKVGVMMKHYRSGIEMGEYFFSNPDTLVRGCLIGLFTALAMKYEMLFLSVGFYYSQEFFPFNCSCSQTLKMRRVYLVIDQ